MRLGAASAAALLGAPWLGRLPSAESAAQDELASALPTRPLGKTGHSVTILGLGGEGVLRTWGRTEDAVAVIRRALQAGITYCDTAPAYSASQDYYGEVLPEYRDRVFLASKTHDRSRDGSLRLLEDSLRRLKTDHLDLWQLHNLNESSELEAIFGRDGAIQAMEQARREGLVRFLGITGHFDPTVLVEAIRRYPFDAILVALNAADRARLSFIEQLLPMASDRGLGIIGMKVLAKGTLLRPDGVATLRHALGYVLSLPVSTAIVGFNTQAQVDEAVTAARAFRPFPQGEMARIEALARRYADQDSWFKRSAS